MRGERRPGEGSNAREFKAPSSLSEEDHYSTLGVSRNSSPAELKAAYRALAQIHHPDKGGNEEDFKLVGQAFEVLSDPGQRETYDLTKFAPSSPEQQTYETGVRQPTEEEKRRMDEELAKDRARREKERKERKEKWRKEHPELARQQDEIGAAKKEAVSQVKEDLAKAKEDLAKMKTDLRARAAEMKSKRF